MWFVSAMPEFEDNSILGESLYQVTNWKLIQKLLSHLHCNLYDHFPFSFLWEYLGKSFKYFQTWIWVFQHSRNEDYVMFCSTYKSFLGIVVCTTIFCSTWTIPGGRTTPTEARSISPCSNRISRQAAMKTVCSHHVTTSL